MIAAAIPTLGVPDRPTLGLASYTGALILSLCTVACADHHEAGASHVGDFVPLNLDYALPGLVQPEAPWGWWLQPMAWAGIESSAVSGELRFERTEPGSAANAVYDLNAALPGRRLELTGSARIPASSGARLRIGLIVLEESGETDEAWSRAARASTGEGNELELSAELEIPTASYNVQVLVEYSGDGEAFLGPLELTVDGQVAGGEAPGQSAPPPDDYAWVRESVVPLDTVEPDAGTADLAALRPIVGDARFVLLGESTHGSRELFTLKHRVVRWLLEQEGFSVFVLEDHVSAAARVDRHLHTGEEPASDAISELFGFWRRQSVLDLVEWMGSAVGDGSLEASFVGIDMQVPTGPFEALEDFTAAYDPSLSGALESTIGSMRAAWSETRYPRRTPEEHQEWIEGARELLALLEERAPSYRARFGDAATDDTLFQARLVLQSAEVSASGDIRVRDRFLTENLSAIAGRFPPETRFVVWAHNTHVRLDESAMGEHLARLHPGEVVSIGLFTQEGSYVAWDGAAMREYRLFAGPVGSIEEILHASGHEILALDLRPGASDPRAPLSGLLHHRNIGLFPADFGFYRTVLPEGFDALLFVDRTTATRALP